MPRRRGARPRAAPQSPICKPKGGHVALVAEKPKAAEKIASALGARVKCRFLGIPYWVLLDGRGPVYIVPSAGHLFGPHSDKRGFPVYEMQWRPLYEFDKTARHTRKFFQLMAYVLPGARLYINACDYDIEGSVIGYTIIEWFGDARRYMRMKFSSLSPLELRAAYRSLEPPDTLLVEAGKARHEVDWLWGINVSRALMHAARRATGRRIILSAGRVQSPTIVEAARRWREINLAVPTPLVSLAIRARDERGEAVFHPSGWRPRSLPEARSLVRRLRGSKVVVAGSRRVESRVRPPPAFNLGDLQREAARLYGYSPMKTQSIAEDLYLDALISYPRTNSQKLPPTIDYATIIRRLSAVRALGLGELARRLLSETGGLLKPVQGPKDDPAHPAIHPTGEIPRSGLGKDHWRIYELIVRRFLAAFSRPAVVARTEVAVVDAEGRRYEARGVTVIEEGWMLYYPYLRPSGSEIPSWPRGARLLVVEARAGSEWRREAPKLSRTSLLAWMESQRIGTEATRARLIETLFKRGYLASRAGTTVVTDLGMIVAEIIEQLFPDLARPALTRRLEQMLDDVRAGRRTRRSVVEETIRELDRLLAEYAKRLDQVGEKLAVSLGLRRPEIACVICGREATTVVNGNALCKYHAEALERLRARAPLVAETLGVSLEEAITRISRLRGRTGKWVIEVAGLITRGELSI